MTSQDTFDWSFTSLYGTYPPFLQTIPGDLDVTIDKIFDPQALGDAKALIGRNTDPNDYHGGPAPLECKTMEEVVAFVRDQHAQQARNMYQADNIGLRDDWYTDAVFGQQTLTGTNPSVISRASARWVEEFKAEAIRQENQEANDLLDKPEDFFVLDYSYLHGALGIPIDAGLPPRADSQPRPKAYGGASVTLFRFEPEGRMHPFAIIPDYQVPLVGPHKSVILFNRRLTSTSPGDESTDWPWRYAKTATQVANWLGHEVGIHLVNAHLVEEICLVAAHRAFASNQDHFVFQLIKPHRDFTLSVNAAARSILVPAIIIPTAGFPAATVSNFLMHSFATFDWTGSYVPNDLRKRGFPVEELGKEKYRNCAWARGSYEMWKITRNFVSTVLQSQYPRGDRDVAADPLIDAFCTEMRGADAGRLHSFPESVKKLGELIDAVTNIIHIATTQHTSVNYLQQYYMTFVPNLPGALYEPIPRTLDDLKKVTEKKLLDSLPIRFECEWLMMGQVPYLLSFSPPGDRSILQYATDTSGCSKTPEPIRAAAETLRQELLEFTDTVKKISADMEDQQAPYLILDPQMSTSSIIL